MSPREAQGFFLAAGESVSLLLVIASVFGFSCESWLGWFTSCPLDLWVALALASSLSLLLAWLLWLVFHRERA